MFDDDDVMCICVCVVGVCVTLIVCDVIDGDTS